MSGRDLRHVRHHGAPRWLGLAASGILAACLLWSSVGRATVVERVVAVVGDRAILMSDIRSRSFPYLNRLQQEFPSDAHRAAAISQLNKQLISQLIDEELIARAARRAKIVVSEQEITAAIERVAKQNNLTTARLLEEALSTGMKESQYREELRRQIIEARMLSLRVQGRVRVRDEDLRAMYLSLVFEERKKLSFDLSWIVLDGRGEDASAQADIVAQRARAGESFSSLARQYSIDATTKTQSGLLGKLTPGKLPAVLDKVAQRMEVGEISAPIRLGDRYVILRLIAREESQLPTFEEARGELGERVYSEKMAKARKRWLEGLRGQTHVDVRL